MSYKSVHTLQNKRWNLAQFFEERWWRHYLRKQSPEDYLDWKRAYWIDFLETTQITLKEGDRVLDAGTGPAGIQMALKDQDVTAIDPLLDTYEELAQFNRAAYPWTTFKRSSIESLEDEELYDHVFCLNVINHVVDIQQACDRLCAGLKRGGNIVLSIDCHKYTPAQWILQRVPLDILHPHQFNLNEYRALLIQRGIRIIHQERIRDGGLFDYWVITGKKE